MYLEFKDADSKVMMSRYSNKNVVVVNDRDDGCSVQFRNGCDSYLIYTYMKLMNGGKLKNKEKQKC